MYKFIKVGGDLFHKKETYNCIVSLISLSFCLSYLSVPLCLFLYLAAPLCLSLSLPDLIKDHNG